MERRSFFRRAAIAVGALLGFKNLGTGSGSSKPEIVDPGRSSQSGEAFSSPTITYRGVVLPFQAFSLEATPFYADPVYYPDRGAGGESQGTRINIQVRATLDVAPDGTLLPEGGAWNLRPKPDWKTARRASAAPIDKSEADLQREAAWQIEAEPILRELRHKLTLPNAVATLSVGPLKVKVAATPMIQVLAVDQYQIYVVWHAFGEIVPTTTAKVPTTEV